MFKIIPIAFSLIFSSASLAEPVIIDKKVACDDTSKMLPFLVDKYNEQPIWVGNIEKPKDSKPKEPSYLAVTLNKETQSWSVIIYNRDISCLIDSGKGYRIPEESLKN